LVGWLNAEQPGLDGRLGSAQADVGAHLLRFAPTSAFFVHRIPDAESVAEKQLQDPQDLNVSSTFSERGEFLASPTFGEAVS